MNRASVIALVLAGILFGCGAGMVAHEVMESEAVAQGPWTGQRWEYHCSAIWNHPKHLTEPEGKATLNGIGAQGWELVQLGVGIGEGVAGIACFKRQLP
jgi:hypothetical protein